MFIVIHIQWTGHLASLLYDFEKNLSTFVQFLCENNPLWRRVICVFWRVRQQEEKFEESLFVLNFLTPV